MQISQAIKQILLLDKENQSYCKIQFLNDDFIYLGEKKLCKPT